MLLNVSNAYFCENSDRYNMIKRFILLFTLLIVLITDSKAQNPAATDEACSASLFCSNLQLNGYTNTLKAPDLSKVPYPKPRGFCGEVDAPSWFKFIASSQVLDLQFTYSACGSGFQAAIFSTTDCADTAAFSLASNCVNDQKNSGSVRLLASNLVAGQTYYLMIDGFSGSFCNYTININNGIIQGISSNDLTVPTVIYGSTDICINATATTYALPYNPKATEYVFNLEINGNPAIGGGTSDTSYTFNISPPVLDAKLIVGYKNNCTTGPTKELVLDITDVHNIKLPDLTLSFGQTKSVKDRVYSYGPTPLATTTIDTVKYTRPSGADGCDTNYVLVVTRLAKTGVGKAHFLKPTESPLVLGGTPYSVTASNCNTLLPSSGDTIYNAKISHSFSPSSLTLNCNSGVVNLVKSDTCANVMHNTTNSWYRVNSNGSLSFVPLTNPTRLSTNNADSFVVVIKDSVIVKGSPLSGYKIYYDTLKLKINGTGAGDIPGQPTTITGSSNACQGVIETYTCVLPARADSLIWSILRGSGTIISGQGTASIKVLWTGTRTNDTIRVIGKNSCFSSPTRDLPVVITAFPNLTAGVDTSLCGLTLNLNGKSGGGSGTWTSVAGNPGIAGFQNSTQATTSVTVAAAGAYKFAWTETKGTCTLSDTVLVTFSAVPQIVNGSIKDSCNAIRTLAYVRFNFAGGTSPYTVYDNTRNVVAQSGITNGFFQSTGFTPGNYSFEVRDASGCKSTLVQGTQACTACTTSAGFMQADNYTICEGDSAKAVYLGSSTLEPNDTLQFVLHTGDPKTGIIARNSKSPNFAFQTGMSYGTIYYISAIAGNKTTTGVDLNDPCFSSSSARTVQVVFNAKPTALMTVSDSLLCSGTCSKLNFTLTGRSPYTITAKISDPTTRDTTFNLTASGTINYCPKVSTNFRLFSIKDANNCIDSVKLTKIVNFSIFQPVTAGPDTSLTICSGTDTTFSLSSLLRGASVGGSWTEVSTKASTGAAFNPIANTFRTQNQAAGTYRFRYTVQPSGASTCPADTSFISITLQTRPIADAGVDDTITCFNPIITIGGNTPTGNNITIQWSSIGNRLSGNAPKQEVSQADTYIITATSNGCSARDSVVISIDTTKPKAVIQPITDSLTCRRDTITLNGASSTPSNIVYLWTLNGSPYDGNPKTVASEGGTYELSVMKLTNGCVATDSIKVKENRVLPTVTIVAPQKLNCVDTIISLNALASSFGSSYQFKWTSSQRGHFRADSTTLEPKVDSGGVYQLRITDTRNGCSDSVSVRVIREVEIPIAQAFASDTLDCYHPTISLSAKGSTLGVGLVYEWRASPGNIVSGENTINAIVDQPGKYYFIAKNERTGCIAVDSVNVIRNDERPNMVNFTTRKPVCYGEQNGSIAISNVQGGTAPYLYSLDGKVFTQRTSFSNLSAGAYKIYVQDAGGCILDSVFNIVQDRQIGVSMGLDTIIKLGDSILLSVGVNSANIKRVVWSSYTDSLCKRDSSCFQQWVRPTRQTTYSVTVIDTGGCKAEGRITISIDKKRPVFIPNTFSPNNDGVNDIFMVYGSQVVKNIKNFQIFDRWGERMLIFQDFKPDNPAFGWDGKLRGKDAASGVYPYFIEIEYLDGAIEIIEGSITLLR